MMNLMDPGSWMFLGSWHKFGFYVTQAESLALMACKNRLSFSQSQGHERSRTIKAVVVGLFRSL